jgi:cyclic pyranopterin phosphate synthase
MKNKKPSPRALSHLSEKGEARMVNVGGKAVTRRRAVARGEVQLGEAAWRALMTGSAPKGDVLAAARIAGIQAAKRTPDLIPLCHPLPLTGIDLTIESNERNRLLTISAEITCGAKTGAEMEALTAVSVACLTIYDMLKGIEKGIVIGPIYLAEKSGGKSGDWKRPSR